MDHDSDESPSPLSPAPVAPALFRHTHAASMVAPSLRPLMTARTHRYAYGLVVHLAEDLDQEVREPLRRALASLIDEPQATIDVTAVDYADTTLLSAIVRLVRQRRACGNELPPRIVGMRPHLRRLFHLTRLDRLVSLHGS